jgi:hypothetical protein
MALDPPVLRAAPRASMTESKGGCAPVSVCDPVLPMRCGGTGGARLLLLVRRALAAAYLLVCATDCDCARREVLNGDDAAFRKDTHYVKLCSMLKAIYMLYLYNAMR